METAQKCKIVTMTIKNVIVFDAFNHQRLIFEAKSMPYSESASKAESNDICYQSVT